MSIAAVPWLHTPWKRRSWPLYEYAGSHQQPAFGPTTGWIQRPGANYEGTARAVNTNSGYLLQKAICVSTEKAEAIVSFFQTEVSSAPRGHLKAGKKDVVIPAGQVTWVRCRVPSHLSSRDQLLLFEAGEDSHLFKQLEVVTGLVEIENPAKTASERGRRVRPRPHC